MKNSLVSDLKYISNLMDSGVEFSVKNIQYVIVLLVSYISFGIIFTLETQLFSLVIGAVLVGITHMIIYALVFTKKHYDSNPFEKITNPIQFFIGTLIYFSIVAFGMLFFLFPGLYLGLRFLYAIPILTTKNETFYKSFKLSWDQTNTRIAILTLHYIIILASVLFILIGLTASYLLKFESIVLSYIFILVFLSILSTIFVSWFSVCEELFYY